MTSSPYAEPGRSELRVGVSACLLGEPVRYDGGHKRDRYLMETLGRVVELVPVCPEMEIGLGAPRETLQLVAIGGRVRLVAGASGRDHTASMRRWARSRLAELARLDLSGYVLKARSPSCGMRGVPIASPGAGAHAGPGLFAAALMARMPLLPVEDEVGIGDAARRDHFLERMFVFRRLGRLFAPRWTVAQVVAFHDALALTLLAHHRSAHAEIARILARAARIPRARLAADYRRRVMEAIAHPATVAGHGRALTRALAMLRPQLDAATRRVLTGALADYRAGRGSRWVILERLRECAQVSDGAGLAGQLYLAPGPLERALRADPDPRR